VQSVTRSAADTIELGRALAERLGPGDVVAFFGELGSGKTTMIKGIAAGLGVTETVRSPSFVIVTEYRGRIPVYHVDLYRLEGLSALEGIGLEDYLGGDGVCLVEWAERAEGFIPKSAIRVRLAAVEAGRSVTVEFP
jgi:tRNA threonylcarbamoyladenosine biosynthesis protein TsaE